LVTSNVAQCSLPELFAMPDTSWSAFALGLVVVSLLVAGCGPHPVTGGTSGVLRAAGEPLADIQVTVHQAKPEGWETIGFADTTADGSFRLLTLGAAGPLTLPTGEYRFTLESVGSPVIIPKALRQADETPLRVQWDATTANLTLELPQKLKTN
jgi:hypothetical protein